MPTLDVLPFLEYAPIVSAVRPSSALRSRKPAHKSARDSLPPEVDVVSEKKSAPRDGVLGVLWKGDAGNRRVL